MNEQQATEEKFRLRAKCLEQRLWVRGLAQEAAALGIGTWTPRRDSQRLMALEKIVSHLAAGGSDMLIAALKENSAGADDVLTSFKAVHDPKGPIATGERLAGLVAIKTDEELAGTPLAPEAADALLEQIEQTADSLQRRLDLAEEAIARLTRAGLHRRGAGSLQ